ncbi:SusD/RagB family nutrient-binding outer membrane lipoprotein [Bacteroides sp.]
MNFLNKSKWLFLSLASFVIFSCTDGFENINKYPLEPPYAPSVDPEPEPEPDPNDDITFPKSITPEELTALQEGLNGIGAFFKKYTYEGLVNDYQRTTSLTHDIYGGYFAANNPSFLTGSPNYIYTEDWSGRRWNHFYKERCDEYKTLARTFRYVDWDTYKNAFYITRIYFVFLTSTMTDTYGEMPFSAYIKGSAVPEKVPYDSQEKIFDMMFRILDEAVTNLVPGQCSFKFSETDDKCYQGNEDKWLRFANTLRLRLALRISNVDPIRAKKEGEAALLHPAGLMQSQDDRMKTIPNHAPVNMGGEGESGQENEVANDSFRYMDVVMSKDMEDAYKNLSSVRDPRCAVCWFKPTPMSDLLTGIENRRTDFTGCEIGSSDINRTSEKYSVLRVNSWEDKSILRDDYWFGYSREYIWLGYAECKFLEAEAALRDWAGVSGTPQSLFEDGIRASMTGYYHLATNLVEDYISGLKIYSGAIENPFQTNNKEGMLEQIITQKWLSIFPNGNEGWAEFRRTDYPRLRNHLSNRDSDINPKQFIKRIKYPNDEYDYNMENVPAAGLVNQSTRVWWDVADTNNASGERNQTNNFR